MLLTISMIVMGDQPLILPCLESIETQTKTEHEIFLVNNMAFPTLIEEVACRFPQVKFIHNSQVLSFAANNNQVLQRSKAQYVLLLNDDTLILNHALDQMVEFMNVQPPEIGIVGCTNLDGKGDFRLSCYPFPNAQRVIWQQIRLGHWLSGYTHHKYFAQAKGNSPFPVDWVQGSCMLVRKAVIETIGYLDEKFFLFNEEVDYCYRAKQAGFLTYQIPQAKIIHYESVSTNRVVPIKIRGHYLSALYFLAKYGFCRDLQLVRIWFIFELLVKSIVRALGALINRPTDARVRLKAYLDLIRICAIYQGEPASELINRYRSVRQRNDY